MKMILKDGMVYTSGTFKKMPVYISDGIVVCSSDLTEHNDSLVIDCSDLFIFPGFTDVHVHFREPGFSYKETIKTGSLAAARGGFTDVCTMPNLNPVPDSVENLKVQTDIIDRDACIRVHPFGSITKGQMGKELSDMEGMSEEAVGFSDDGRGVQSDEMMEKAMLEAKRLNKIVSAHCEVNSLLNKGYIHDGEYAKLHGHRGICSESEWGQIKRDIELAERIGCKYHVCHISTKESVELIRQAKARGVDITCETAPHYLIFDDMDLQEDGRFKMNPPIRSKEDKEALIKGLQDGTIDMIATDHAPHSAEEKSKGLEFSNMGVVGIETSFAMMYTYLVKKGIITLEKLMEVMYENPSKRFGFDKGIEVGKKADLTVFDLNNKYIIDPDEFQSMGRSTPFANMEAIGRCLLTVCDGRVVWKNGQFIENKTMGE